MSKPGAEANARWKAAITRIQRDIAHPVHGLPKARQIKGHPSVYAYDARLDLGYAKECENAVDEGRQERVREAARKAKAFEKWWIEQHATGGARDQ